MPSEFNGPKRLKYLGPSEKRPDFPALYRGPAGTVKPGQVLECSEAEAARLLKDFDGGFEDVTPAPAKK